MLRERFSGPIHALAELSPAADFYQKGTREEASGLEIVQGDVWRRDERRARPGAAPGKHPASQLLSVRDTRGLTGE